MATIVNLLKKDMFCGWKIQFIMAYDLKIDWAMIGKHGRRSVNFDIFFCNFDLHFEFWHENTLSDTF